MSSVLRHLNFCSSAMLMWRWHTRGEGFRGAESIGIVSGHGRDSCKKHAALRRRRATEG